MVQAIIFALCALVFGAIGITDLNMGKTVLGVAFLCCAAAYAVIAVINARRYFSEKKK